MNILTTEDMTKTYDNVIDYLMDIPVDISGFQNIMFAVKALRKQIPTLPLMSGQMYQCPSCRRNLTTKEYCTKTKYKYCPKCGQCIDWEGVIDA